MSPFHRVEESLTSVRLNWSATSILDNHFAGIHLLSTSLGKRVATRFFFFIFFLSDDVVEYGDFLVALGFHAGGSVRVINQPLRLSLAKKKPSVKPESVGGRHVPRSAAGARNANNTNKIKK